MADTERTLAALLALLPDNTNGDISPQDVRDFLVSAFGGYGSIYVTGGATAQTVSGTPAKMTGFAANSPSSSSVTPDHTNDQIAVTVAGDYSVDLLMAGFTGSNGSTITLDVYVNGSPSTIPSIVRAFGTPASSGSACTTGILTLAANDIVTVYVSSTSTSYTPTEATLKLSRLS